jgi:hypothetical protein
MIKAISPDIKAREHKIIRETLPTSTLLLAAFHVPHVSKLLDSVFREFSLSFLYVRSDIRWLLESMMATSQSVPA